MPFLLYLPVRDIVIMSCIVFRVVVAIFICIFLDSDCLCGLVVRVPGYKSRCSGSIRVQLRSYLEEKLAAPV
jgi:hypothetical protein